MLKENCTIYIHLLLSNYKNNLKNSKDVIVTKNFSNWLYKK